MSQAVPSDADPSADGTPPPCQTPQDVSADLTPPSAPLQPPLIPESFVLPQSTDETTTEDTTAEASEGPTDQPEPTADGQVFECDQPVSLEPEAAEEEVEVCSTSFFTFSWWHFLDIQSILHHDLSNSVFIDITDINIWVFINLIIIYCCVILL